MLLYIMLRTRMLLTPYLPTPLPVGSYGSIVVYFSEYVPCERQERHQPPRAHSLSRVSLCTHAYAVREIAFPKDVGRRTSAT